MPLRDLDRRKVDRYLDVTKAALLFGGRALLIEGIAEALLLPAIAKHHVLKDHPEKLRLFRSALFIPIDGVDFAPYVTLLLTELEGARIADRVVVMTDGDRGMKKTTDDDPSEGTERLVEEIGKLHEAEEVDEAPKSRMTPTTMCSFRVNGGSRHWTSWSADLARKITSWRSRAPIRWNQS